MKYLKIALATCVLGSALYAAPINAQERYGATLDALTAINRTPPLQNYEFDTSAQILSRRILDRKNKTVGEVRNVVVNDSGSISSLAVEFNRLRLPADVFLNYREMVQRPASKGYILTLDDDTLEDRFAELLAATETAAGRSDIHSVRDMIGALLKSRENNQKIGVVRDVLFSNDGENAAALYVEMTLGLLRGTYVAIPFAMPKWQQEAARTKKTATLSATQTKALIELTKEL